MLVAFTPKDPRVSFALYLDLTKLVRFTLSAALFIPCHVTQLFSFQVAPVHGIEFTWANLKEKLGINFNKMNSSGEFAYPKRSC